MMQRRTYHTLDGLRGVAALSIVVLHTPHFFGTWQLPNCFLAVDLFFILSGFVLEEAYGTRVENGLSVLGFLRIRVVRLYPLYLLSTVVGIPVAMLATRYGGLWVQWTPTLFGLSLPLSLVMLPTPRVGATDLLYPFNPVLWSIFFEVLINLCYALAFRYIRSALILLSVVFVSAVALVALGLLRGTLDAGYSWETFGLGLARVTFGFFAGVLIHRLVRPRTIPHKTHFALAPLIVLVLLFSQKTGVALQLLEVILLLPILLILASRVSPSAAISKTFGILGVSSYAVYALHKPVYQFTLAIMIHVFRIQQNALAPWIGLAYLPSIVAVCIIVDAIYDTPVRRWLNVKLPRL